MELRLLRTADWFLGRVKKKPLLHPIASPVQNAYRKAN